MVRQEKFSKLSLGVVKSFVKIWSLSSGSNLGVS